MLFGMHCNETRLRDNNIQWMALLIKIRYSLTIAKFEQRVGRLGKNMRKLTFNTWRIQHWTH